jgi:hypothetical protein
VIHNGLRTVRALRLAWRQGSFDLAARCFGNCRVFESFCQIHHGDTLVAETNGPLERHALVVHS